MIDQKEWFADFPKLTVIPWIVWAITIGLVIGGVLYAAKVQAEPRFVVQDKNITVTLYDEPCELKHLISNLPYKAVWKEGDRTYQGCFGPRPDVGMVMAYFDDLAVALIPFDALKKATGA